MKIKICKCKQCKAQRRGMKSKYRKKCKRQTSKARRRMKRGQVLNFYYA